MKLSYNDAALHSDIAIPVGIYKDTPPQCACIHVSLRKRKRCAALLLDYQFSILEHDNAALHFALNRISLEMTTSLRCSAKLLLFPVKNDKAALRSATQRCTCAECRVAALHFISVAN